MNGILLIIRKNLKQLLNKKGQDVVEFALILAFCACIGLFSRKVGFARAIEDSLDNGKPALYTAAIGMKFNESYMTFFRKWRKADSDYLNKSEKNEERIVADQKALVKIAETYLGRTESQVLDLMNLFSNSPTGVTPPFIKDLKCENENGTGFSVGVLVPLSYKIDTQTGGLWLDANKNQNTVKFLTDNEAEVYDKNDTNNPAYHSSTGRKTLVMDRLFYSEDMLNNQNKTVSLRLHYTDGVVDSLDISVRNGGWNNNAESIGKGLCLHVTEAGYSENQHLAGKKDIVRDPWAYYTN